MLSSSRQHYHHIFLYHHSLLLEILVFFFLASFVSLPVANASSSISLFPHYFYDSSSSNNNYLKDTFAASNYQFIVDYHHPHHQHHHDQLETSLATWSSDDDNRLQMMNARAFFATVKLTLATSWSTYYTTTTTTCTTSTANIKVCSPSKGRRRRGNFGIHRLVFEEEDFDFDDERNIFDQQQTPFINHNQNEQFEDLTAPFIEQPSTASSASAEVAVPYVIQPGFSSSDFVGEAPGRFLISFGTKTQVTTSTLTYYYILTATCQSTTAYQTCGTGYPYLYYQGK